MYKLYIAALALLINFVVYEPVFAGKRAHTSYSRSRTYCNSCARDSHGRIKRDSSVRQRFLRSQGYTHTPKGYEVEHTIPLYRGGTDTTSNMRLTPKAEHRARHREEYKNLK